MQEDCPFVLISLKNPFGPAQHRLCLGNSGTFPLDCIKSSAAASAARSQSTLHWLLATTLRWCQAVGLHSPHSLQRQFS